MGTSMEDRRKDARHPLRLQLAYSDTGGSNFLFEYSTNISKGGIFIETHHPLPLGTEIVLRFTPPGEAQEQLEVEGDVVWVNPFKPEGENFNPGMGIQFKNLSDENKDTITQIVRTVAILPDED